MKRKLIFPALLLLLLGAVLVWANHLANPIPVEARADLVVLEKAKRELTIYSQGQPLKKWTPSIGQPFIVLK